jgi:hypothetical protein
VQPPRSDGPLKDGEGRPSVKKYAKVTLPCFCSLREAYTLTRFQGFKFLPDDKVRIKATTTDGLRGPFTVYETHTGPKYTLEKSDHSKVDNGKKFKEDELEHV